jgi:regulator of protease activity HflC (stomatin/prohibitin superfamily)
MMPENWIAILLVGLIAGVASGMFGIGGGVVIVPALVILGFNLKEAVGTSLGALLMPVGIFAVIAYYRAGKLKISIAVPIAAGLIGGSIVGAQIVRGLQTSTLQQLYGVFLLWIGWRFAEPRKIWRNWRSRTPAPAAVEDNTDVNFAWYFLLVVGLVAGVLLSLVAQGILIVEPTQVAVVVNTLTGTLETPARGAGTSVVIPVVQQYYLYPITQQQYTMSGRANEGQVSGNDAVAARTIDGQEVALDVTVLYAVDPAKVNDLHKRWQTGYQDNFVRPTVRGLVRDVVSGYRAEDIYGEKRTEMEDTMQQRISDRFASEGLALTDLLVRDISFSEQFRQAIEQKQIADQDAQRAQLQIRQRENEASQLRAQANGERDAAIARAQGQAQATVLQAQAEAEALRLVSEQIAANPRARSAVMRVAERTGAVA